MLILKKPETSELELFTQVKASCCNCTQQEIIKANSVDEGARMLQIMGWRAYETEDEISPLVCPRCVEDLQLIEEEEQAA